MQMIAGILIMTFLSLSVKAEQGTMSTDNSPASSAEASLSGFSSEEIDLREEEVELQEDDYDPTMDNDPIQIEIDKERRENSYEDELFNNQ